MALEEPEIALAEEGQAHLGEVISTQAAQVTKDTHAAWREVTILFNTRLRAFT